MPDLPFTPHRRIAAFALAATAAAFVPVAPAQTQSGAVSAASQAAARAAGELPPPDPQASRTRFSKVIGWSPGVLPQAPEGFAVQRFAAGLANPRSLYVLPNGDVLTAEASTEAGLAAKGRALLSGKAKSQNLGDSANRISLLRDADGDGGAELQETFLAGLRQPYGMLLLGDTFYVATTDAVWAYPYAPGETRIRAPGRKLFELPAGGYNNHWTRNLAARRDGRKLYVSVGSGSNIGEHGLEHEAGRALIFEFNPDGSGRRVYASGLRNPTGLAFAPDGVLWTAVNERDGLGDDLVPDYLTHVVDGGFYGWPFRYWGAHPDPRVREAPPPALAGKAIVPDLSLGAHTASLGLTFYTGRQFPERYRGGAFVGQHGSWNRSRFAGYRVVFVPFRDGRPAGAPEDFLTGFIADEAKREVHGRPVGVAVAADGALLVADDASGTIWRVRRTP